MSSVSEMSIKKDACSPENRENSARRRFGRGFQNGANVAPDQRLLRSRKDKGSLLGSESLLCKSPSQTDEMEGRSVIWGCEGRPGTPVDVPIDVLEYVPQQNVECIKFWQCFPKRDAWVVRRQRSVQSSGIKQHASCGSREAGPSRRGARAKSCVEAKQVSAGPLYRRGAGRGLTWVTPRQHTPSKVMDVQHLSSDCESSYESTEIPIIRVTISIKEKDQVKTSSATELGGDTAKQSNASGGESFVHKSAPLLTTASQGLASGTEKQASSKVEPLFCKKKQSVIWGKAGSRRSHPRSATAAAAPAGRLNKASATKKPAQERKPLYEVPGVILGSSFPPWGQRIKSVPVEPSTFPPVTGVALFGKTTRCPLVPLEPKRCTGKRSVGKKTKEPLPAAREEAEPAKEPALQPQSVEKPAVFMHPGDFSSGDRTTRATQTPGNSQRLALSQRGIRSNSPTSSGLGTESSRTKAPPLPAGLDQDKFPPAIPERTKKRKQKVKSNTTADESPV
uniref:uncharacterized protein CXorf49 homolog n=1 Tax=Jaculus jaculus TaxID=51337 RepID=UPI001E1B2B23|nr:uncharacterized protein CXorf49 homolog [Jaculus jaculus]